uniref:Uncharacterized protein n=1 Tax=Fagus sylvatica TaxID=28930 RepID=A0A2N9EDU1_FAGSY
MFFGCTDSGELLIDTYGRGFVSYDPESLNENNLGIQSPSWLTYTADLMENLVLPESGKMSSKYELLHSLRWNLIQLCVFERNLREATKTSSYARPLRVEYPSFPYVPWTGGAVEADFFEESCSLIGSMKNWICSSSQSSFSRLNKLSHEINFLRNRMESQASTIRSLLRLEDQVIPFLMQLVVRESTTLATLRDPDPDIFHSGEQITLDDDDEEDKEDATPFPWKSVLERLSCSKVFEGSGRFISLLAWQIKEATNTSTDACAPSCEVPSLPSWEVQVTNDFGEGETMIVPRSKHVPYVPWTGGACRNRVESQASTIRTLEAGRSSDPIPDAAGSVTPPADEGNPMNTTVQSNKGSSQRVKCLAPERPSCPQVRESTTLATLRSKSGHLHSGEQITLDDDVEEDKEDTTPLVQRQSKRVRL